MASLQSPCNTSKDFAVFGKSFSFLFHFFTPLCIFNENNEIQPPISFFHCRSLFVFHRMYVLRRRQWHPTPVLLPGKSHGQRSHGWGCWGSDMTERLCFHFSLLCIGEGNGNPLQCSSWRIPGMAEPGGLLSMGLHRVGHDWSNLAAAVAMTISLRLYH